MKAEIKNLKKAASRILKAVKQKEKIIIYGDADLDGVSYYFTRVYKRFRGRNC